MRKGFKIILTTISSLIVFFIIGFFVGVIPGITSGILICFIMLNSIKENEN